jgi:DNA-binding MarR family transcriptional regulator
MPHATDTSRRFVAAERPAGVPRDVTVPALPPDLPPHHSAEEILAHPRFGLARDAMLQAMLALYEHNPFLNRLLLEVGRNVLFVVIMCLHARHDEADRGTWPTLQLVKDSMAAFGLASPRRVADLVSRLVKTRYLEQRASSHDRRVRILVPTARMIAQDQDWLVSHYVPLQVMFPDPGYAPIMGRDPAFQLQQRLVAASLFPLAVSLMQRNPVIMHFQRREAGVMLLITLIQLAGPSPDTSREISYSDIGVRFGVSRTQVRKLIQEAEAHGLVHVMPQKSGQVVRLTTRLVQAFDHFIADTMAGHDLVYNMARRAQADAQPGSMRHVPWLPAGAASNMRVALPPAARQSA